mmetsp:Transcript_24240/g.43116  ORF Transcript_24240/g.43116 Transcript_24240/m.43116 type:complete len:583 (+) Transcript_24240:253-2001(+)
MIAYATLHPETKPFVKAYFNKSVRLPNDMLEIVGIAQTLSTGSQEGKLKIPKVLQRAIQEKFPEFNIYQLGKYCSEGKRKRQILKKKAILEKKRQAEEKAKLKAEEEAKNKANEENPDTQPQVKPADPESEDSESGSDSESDEGEQEESKKPQIKKPEISMKQLVRKCHVNAPPKEVLSILGKKYPATEEDFAKSGLGQFEPFDPSRSGKRMKIPTPITWETELSEKGNSARVWEELVKTRKLPFMAMLRNLRNMITTGVDEETHNLNIARLSDADQVAKSRLFPFRFLSAGEEIKIDVEAQRALAEHRDSDTATVISESKKRRAARKHGKRYKLYRPANPITQEILDRYQQGIEAALRHAATSNVKPILGHSVIFCDVSGSMQTPLSKGSGMGSKLTCKDVGILLGLMLRLSCESADIKIFSSPREGKCWLPIEEANTGSILADMDIIKTESSKLGGGTDFPYDYIETIIEERTRIDTMFIFSDMMVSPGKEEMQVQRQQNGETMVYTISNILAKYRQAVNPNMRFVTVNLAGHGRKFLGADYENNFLNVEVTGYSDAILRLVSELQATQVGAVKDFAGAK